MQDPVETLTFEINADTSQLQASLREADRIGARFARTLTSAFEGVAVRGRKLDDVVKSIALSLSRSVFNAAFKPIEQTFASVFNGVFSGFAAGGVPGRQLPVPFASGGVVASPTTFAFGRGQLGVMGERGAEAILPLARGPDGRLGVRNGGRGGGVQISFNVTAADAQSFQRSETQIGAMLSRIIARGERNL